MKISFAFYIILFIFVSNNITYSQSFSLDSIVQVNVNDCYGSASGSITVYVSGGQIPYLYSKDGGSTYQPGNVFSGLTSGVYLIFTKDFFNVIKSRAVFITQPPQIFISNVTHTNVTGCYGNNNGTITITATGGTGALQYSIDNGANYYSNGGVFNGLLGGNYNIKVRDANLCVKNGPTITVTQPLQLIITNELVTNILGCFGVNNGSIDIITTGGTAPIRYSIDGGLTFGPSGQHFFSGLAPGNYPVVVRDNNGCITIGSTLMLSGPGPVVINSQNSTPVNTCYGEATGTITIAASGGTGTLYYSIDGGTNYINNGNFINLFAGTYQIKVQDENLCTMNGADIIINQPSQIIIDSEVKTDVLTCFGDATGQIIINAHGGILPLEYSINSGGTYQAGNIFAGLISGSYSSRVRDANLCVITGQDHLITQPVMLRIDTVYSSNVFSCFGDNDANMSIYTNGGGTQPYTYSLDGGMTFPYGNIIPNLFAGIYQVDIRDAQNCTDTYDYPVTITGPDQLIITSEIPVDPTCFGSSNGTITISANGGTGQIQYSPNNGVSYYYGNILTGLSAGIPYQIKVKDGHNCETSGGIHTLSQPPELIINSIVKQDVNDCFGMSNGSITINASGGTPALLYSINGGSSYQSSNLFVGLPAGNYPVKVKDANECNVFGGIIKIKQPDILQVSFQSFVNIIGCHGDLIGEIHFDAIGGTPHILNGYQYSINGGANFYYNNGDFTGLGAGSYSLVVKDENGCLAYGQPVTITEPDQLTLSLVSQQNVSCYSGSNGNLNLRATGGQIPYQFSINGGITYKTGTLFNNLTAGSYQTYVKDHFNCIVAGPIVIITQPDSLSIDVVTATNIEHCYGDHDGAISILASNGTAPYYYSIDNGNSFYNNSGNFTNLAPGNYYVRIYDAHDCQAFSDLNHDGNIDTVTITQPDQLQITGYDKTDISCFGQIDGTIQILTIGGTGDIHYSIDNGVSYPNTTGFFNNLSQGAYVIKTMDDNGCTSDVYTVNIFEPEVFQITNVMVQNETCPGLGDGSIRFYINGGTFPYRFSADNGANYQSNNIISNLIPGTYYPAAIDTNGCTAVYPEIIIEPGVHAGFITSDITEGCDPLDVQFTRLSPGITYLWDFGDGTTSIQNEPSHTFNNITLNPVIYTVTAYSLSPANCTDTTFLDITVYPRPQLDFTPVPNVAYYPDATIELINDSQPGYTNYYWDFGDGTNSTEEYPGTHTYGDCGEYVIRMSANNIWCTDTMEKLVTVITYQPEVFFDADTTQSCFPVTINFTNQSQFITDFIWDLGDGTSSIESSFSHTYEFPGTYLVTLNANGWCDTNGAYDTLITVFDSPEVNFEVFPDTVMLPDQPIHCNNLSSEDSELFLWEFGDGGTSNYENPVWLYTIPGTYLISLTVTSVNKCIDSLTLAAQVIVLPEGEVLFPNAFTPDNDGINDVFMPAVYESVKTFSFEVYNRWGERVFFTNDIQIGWNGYFNGKLAPQDVYVWRTEGIYLNGTPFEYSGSITLIR
jgi:gliding motility-associated-like protein